MTVYETQKLIDKLSITGKQQFEVLRPGFASYGSNAYYTAISRKVVGKSARDNPERHCG